MTRTMTRLASLAALAAAVTLTGCPRPPELVVTPLSLAFSATGATTQNLRITNAGGGTLTWTASESVPWLTLTEVGTGKQSDSISGSLSASTAIVSVALDRSALPLDGGQTTIEILSNGGTVSVPVTANQAPTPTLAVTPDALAFGSTLAELPLTITNTGGGDLTWSVSPTAGAPWLTAVPASGTISGKDASTTVTVKVNRAGLGGGDFSAALALTTNAGDRNIPVTMRVSPFSLDPAEIDFGSIQAQTVQTITLRNNTTAPIQVDLSVLTSTGEDWLTISSPLVTVPVGATGVSLTVTANPATVVPGDYNAVITAVESVTGFTETAPVTMRLTGLSVAPASIDFGTISTTQSQQVVVSNLGVTPLAFTVNVPGTEQAWLSVTPSAGAVTTTTPLTVTVNPAAVAPGAYAGTVTVAFDGGAQSFSVAMRRPTPASLLVNPASLDFGTSLTNATIGIWNPGIGTVNWSIDTTGFPAWLSLVPTNGAGIASGTVSGETTDAVSVRVDRNQAPNGTTDFSHTFDVNATGDFTGTVPVRISMTKPLIPVITLIGDGTDVTGLPFVNLDVDVEQRPLIIRNDGNGPLSWRIDLANKPAWISSISPSQGSLLPGVQATITITVDRSTLTFIGAQTTLNVLSDDPRTPVAPFLVEVQVAKRAAIGTRQAGGFAFGLSANSALLEIGNVGDPETVLTYQLASSKDWLSVFPASGTSIGTGTPLIDWQPHTLSVDRSLLEGSGSSAVVTATAFKVENGIRVPDPSIEPLQVTVTVEAATLTIEGAAPRTRIPSLVRTVMLLRNVRYQALPIPDSRLADIGNQFLLSENSEELELTETNQFLRNSNRLTTNMLILLDYSGSMLATARALEADGQIGDGITPLADPVQTMYEQCIPQLLTELPANYRIGLAVFSERSTQETATLRVLREDGLAPIFTRDRNLLLARLTAANVRDNGATQLLSALVAGATLLADQNNDQHFIPFDDADVNALLCVTDGRITTTLTSLPETADFLAGNRVRLFTIGFGQNVAATPLVSLTSATGGHLYSTRSVPTGQVDAFGQPIRKPLISELVDWCSTDLLDECDQSINKDLRSQVVLSYTTLLQEAGVSQDNRLTFNDPNDQNSPCLPEQGQITGSLGFTQLDFLSIAGDVRLGQISLSTDGIQPDGTATVIVRGEYMPRNITSFTFDIDSLPVATVGIVPSSRGGMIPDWTQSVNGTQYTFSSPDGQPLQYGDFGDMLELQFTGLGGPFVLTFDVVSPERTEGQDAKYFTCPDAIFVGNEEFKATAFPRPGYVITPSLVEQVAPDGTELPSLINLGSNPVDAQIDIYNVGGSYVRPGAVPDPRYDVGLQWTATIEEAADAASDQTPGQVFRLVPETGFSTSALTPTTLRIVPDRAAAPGIYYSDVTFFNEYGSIPYNYFTEPIRIRVVISPTTLSFVSPVLDFDTQNVSRIATLSLSNATNADWSVVPSPLPAWLSISNTAGSILPPETTANITVNVDRTGLPPGDYQHTIVVQSTGNPDQTLLVAMRVP